MKPLNMAPLITFKLIAAAQRKLNSYMFLVKNKMNFSVTTILLKILVTFKVSYNFELYSKAIKEK